MTLALPSGIKNLLEIHIFGPKYGPIVTYQTTLADEQIFLLQDKPLINISVLQILEKHQRLNFHFSAANYFTLSF